MIKLGRLRFENFKSFLRPEVFDLSDNDIVLLDGPNGFGKTTIFDAIELCFRQEVDRFFNTDTKQKKNHLLKNDISLDTYIFLELKEGSETKFVIFIHVPANTSTTENKSNACKVRRKILKEWPAVFDNDQLSFLVSEEVRLEDILGNEQLKDTFNIFNYIQQEETCHFLKQKEADRHKQLSYLFGTLKESEERDKFKWIQVKLKERLDYLNNTEIFELKNRSNELKLSHSQLFERFNDGEVKNSGKISLFDEFGNVALEKINEYSSKLSDINWLIGNSSKYSRLLLNYQIEVMTNEREQELRDLVVVGSATKYDDIKKLDKHMRWIVSLENKINNLQNLIHAFEEESIKILKGDVLVYFKYFSNDLNQNQSKVDRYNDLEKQSGAYGNVLSSILLSRKKLLDEYSSHIRIHGTDDQINCPLCGLKKKSLDILLSEYNNQTRSIEGLLSDTSKDLNKVAENLLNQFVSPVVLKAKSFIFKYKELLPLKSVIASRQVSIDRWEKMNKVKNWLNSNKIEYLPFVQQNLLDINEIPDNKNYIELTALIRSFSKSLDEDYSYQTLQNSLKILNLQYRNDLLLNNEEQVIYQSDLEHDLDFIEFTKSQKLSSENIKIENSIKNKSKQSEALSAELDKVKEIIAVYNKKIKEYEQKVAQQIAIPFYVYSSKILQTRPEGNGIYLKTSENSRQNGYIRFASTSTDDHDAWNMMSSGQLSGLVISFMLAMNKVYPSNLATLLIDDPVQTMDEINMASFAQLLKYEFSDKQLILSTHEKKVASYLAYKYQQSNLKTTSINLKQRRLNNEV